MNDLREYHRVSFRFARRWTFCDYRVVYLAKSRVVRVEPQWCPYL